MQLSINLRRNCWNAASGVPEFGSVSTGEHELRRGATEAAIEQLTKCYQLLPLVEGAINPESVLRLARRRHFVGSGVLASWRE